MSHKSHSRKSHRRRFSVQPGLSPGTISLNPHSSPTVVRAVAYGPDGFEEEIIHEVEDVDGLRSRWPFVWIHVQGLGDLTMLASLQRSFGIHKLALEDMVNGNQRPKVEAYDEHNYLVAMHPTKGETLGFHQVNLILGQSYVLSFTDDDGGWDEMVRRRIRDGRKTLLTLGPGYLAYALLDAVVDHYFPVLDSYAETLLVLEEAALDSPDRKEIALLHALSSELTAMKRVLSPLLETLNLILRVQDPLVGDELKLYYRDCLDHVARLLDEIETNREIARSLVDTCLTTMSHRMSEVMKVLTIISTIFIPLSFIAGVWGMNFDTSASPYNMPELKWAFGYPLAVALMVVVAALLLIYFRAKGWLGPRERS